MSEKLDRMKTQKEKAEQKLRYYQHQEKMLEHRIPELTRKARTHRLCTRGGMLESFLICPGELTDDQVMELFQEHQPDALMIEVFVQSKTFFCISGHPGY